MTNASSLRPRLSTRTYHLPWTSGDGPRENRRCSGMADTGQQERGSILLGLHQFLPPLHPRVLRPCAPDVRPYTEGLRMAVGGSGEVSLRGHSDSRDLRSDFGIPG